MQILGSILVSLVGFRLLQSIFGSFQTQIIAKESRRKALMLLDEQIAATQALHRQRENEQQHWNGYRKFRVERKVLEAENICSLYLIPHDEKKLPHYRPGQFLTFRFNLPEPETGTLKPVVRCYSLSDAPRSDYYRITVKRVPPPPGSNVPAGRISNYFHDQVKEGDILDIQAPRGEFAIDPHDTSPVVLIGGGVGITPLLSMINTVLESDSTRDVWLFYGVRCGREHAMREHLQQLDEAHENFHLSVYYSCPDDSDQAAGTYHHAGHVDVGLIRDALKVCNFDYYICGPPPMMESLVPALKDWGVPKEKIHTEAFGPATVHKAAKPVVVPGDEDESDQAQVTIQFSRSGVKLNWDSAKENLLEFALSQGINIDCGCRAGSCGSCEVAVKQGRVGYTIEPGAELGEGSCLTCIGYPETDLVIDA